MTRSIANAAPGMNGQRTALRNFVAGWAALGITLGGATQLRVAGPFGPSEGILAVWILFVSFLLLRGVPFIAGRVLLGMLAYWIVSLTLLSFGALVAMQTHYFHRSDAIHDGMAFTYMAILTCLLSLGLRDGHGREYHLQLARMAFLFTSVAAALLLCAGIASIGLGPIRLWYGGVRFTGWAENPNQLALAVVAMPFLGWYLLDRASSVARKAAYLLGIGFCVAAGVATLSDSLRVGWAASLCALGGLLWYRVVLRGRSRWLYVSHLMIPAVVLIVGISYGDAVATYLDRVMQGIYEDRGQGEKRFTLWFHGIEVIRTSPLVGFGPGPFSGYEGPFGGREAHNSLIDWGMSTGLVGIALNIALWGWCIQRTVRSGSPALLGMAVSVFVLSLFGYMLRQPVYWLILLLALRLAERRAELARQEMPQLDRSMLRPAQMRPHATMRPEQIKLR